eukprot:1090222-Pelagomonas_calceolata.AAC.1
MVCRSRPRILGLADRLLEDAGCKKKQLLPTKAENGQLVHFTRTGTCVRHIGREGDTSSIDAWESNKRQLIGKFGQFAGCLLFDCRLLTGRKLPYPNVTHA